MGSGGLSLVRKFRFVQFFRTGQINNRRRRETPGSSATDTTSRRDLEIPWITQNTREIYKKTLCRKLFCSKALK